MNSGGLEEIRSTFWRNSKNPTGSSRVDISLSNKRGNAYLIDPLVGDLESCVHKPLLSGLPIKLDDHLSRFYSVLSLVVSARG